MNPDFCLDIQRYAADGVLAEGIDKLEDLKQLNTDSNPVIFYCRF